MALIQQLIMILSSKKEHHFLRNIFTKEELQTSFSIGNLKVYYEYSKNFIYVSTCLITKNYNIKTNLEEIEDDLIMTNFMVECGFETFDELLLEISQYKMKNISTLKKTS